ncbi:MAG: SDR family NAD(P)-dependent oxidoreductase [Dehalococcoidia bacterium]|nr:SDR family NAD(P)-dependent oxidoreductase [Dehalococcoidia bacterium]
MQLQNRVAIVTGGGRDIGRAIALAFAREGAHLALAARTLSEVEAVAEEVRSSGRQALAFKADVSRKRDAEALVAAAIDRYGRVDILVNNAGEQLPIGPLWENDADQWLSTVQTNLGGVFLCSRAAIPAMMNQGKGKIVNLSGGGATAPRTYFTAYAASKAALVRLTETLGEELKPFNIQVNAVAPGAVYTKMTEQVLAAGSNAGEKALKEAQRIKEEQRTPDAAAELAVFLASEKSGGLTGRLISAVWDDWRSLPVRLDEVMGSDLYTLRRVTKRE